MDRSWACVAVMLLTVVWCGAQENGSLVVNGDFSVDADADGIADGWRFVPNAPPEELRATLSMEPLPGGGFAQKIDCSHFETGHVMLAQVGTVSIQRGQWYELVVRFRGENLSEAWVLMQDTDGWKPVSRSFSLRPREQWREVRLLFEAKRDSHQTNRLQVWFTSTGTLWLSDLRITPAPAPQPRNVHPDTGHTNLLPNGGFELHSGWSMVNYWALGWERRLVGGADDGACAAIRWDPDDPEYATFFDYFEMTRRPLRDPYLQCVGYVPLKAGETYTLSAYMRADRPGVPAMIGLQGEGGAAQSRVELTDEWQRYSVTCVAKGGLSLVQLGPTLKPEDQEAFGGCTVLLDSVQLQRGAEATDFVPRPLEVAVEPILAAVPGLDAVAVQVPVQLYSRQPGPVDVRLRLTDFSDAPVADLRRQVQASGTGGDHLFEVKLPGPEFYRATATARRGPLEAEGSGRLVFHPELPEQSETAFGINHAYGFDAQVRLARQLGISWVRDWSLKWEHVETEPGRFTFDQSDFHIARPRRQGMQTLCMFPFPSAEWSSTAAPELRTTGYPGNRIRQAFAPQSIADLGKYVETCARHCSPEVRVWEVFNESLFTSYSLPRDHGYDPEDYVPLLAEVAAACKRADPQCRVIGGYSAPPSMLHLYGPMFRAGGLNHCDMVSVHAYPSGEPEGLEAQLRALLALMDESGGRKPLWMTEFAYYADDDPDPFAHGWPDLLDSEWQQACYNTRACVIMLANGVEKVFYHIWTTVVNRDSGAALFFEDAGAPRKIAATQAAMCRLLGARPEFLRRLELEGDLHGYVFRAPEAAGANTAVLWLEYGSARMDKTPDCDYFDTCGTRLTGPAITLSEAPVYVLIPADEAAGAGLSEALQGVRYE